MLKPQVQSIIKKSLNSDSHDVRLQMLLNIADFLAAEEAKALSGASTKSKPKKTKKPKQGNYGPLILCELFVTMSSDTA